MRLLTHVRGTTWLVAFAVLSLLLLAVPAQAQSAAPNDGGSGRDAGDSFQTALPIKLGKGYRGSLDSEPSAGLDFFSSIGDEDWYTFSAKAGQRIYAEAHSHSYYACARLVAPDTSVLHDAGCQPTTEGIVAPRDGTYALAVHYEAVYGQAYDIVVTLDGSAAELVDMGTPSGRSTGPGQVVVAVADSGVNPYHKIYRRPGNTAHPCTWVEGFDDCSIPALDLSIGEHASVEEAFEADREIWESVEEHQWYWIPGTNIVGAVCDYRMVAEPLLDEPSGACIFDEDGHGTATTSSVLSEAPDALLLVHEGGPGATDLKTAPVVPDIQSHSWGAYAPLPAHFATLVTNEDPYGQKIVGKQPWDPETILFNAAGNNAPFPTIIDSNKVDPETQVVGGGYPGFWTKNSWTTADFTSWYCRPTATHTSITEYAEVCGTSFSAPTVAGTAAAALREIRISEGTSMRSTPEMVSETVSRDEFVTALRAGATYDAEPGRFPTRPEPGDEPLVEGAEHLTWGYGWIDRTRIGAIVACALDGICPAKSAEAEQYNATRQQIRAAQPGPWK